MICNIFSFNISQGFPVATKASYSNIVTKDHSLDNSLPSWAKRSHPIVRRQLGLYWRVLTPQIDWIFRWYIIQAGVVLLTIPLPALLTPILMMILASFMLLPYAVYLYFKIISNIIADSVTSITKELKDDTLKLLRVTPISIREIILSKVSATFWRRMEDIDTVLSFWLFLGTPVVLLFQILAWGPEEHNAIPQIVTILGMFTWLVRIPLEAFMVSMLGVLIGSSTRTRSIGITATGSIVGFYYVLMIMPRFISNLPLPVWILIEVILPIVVPLVIIIVSLSATVYLLSRD